MKQHGCPAGLSGLQWWKNRLSTRVLPFSLLRLYFLGRIAGLLLHDRTDDGPSGSMTLRCTTFSTGTTVSQLQYGESEESPGGSRLTGFPSSNTTSIRLRFFVFVFL